MMFEIDYLDAGGDYVSGDQWSGESRAEIRGLVKQAADLGQAPPEAATIVARGAGEASGDYYAPIARRR